MKNFNRGGRGLSFGQTHVCHSNKEELWSLDSSTTLHSALNDDRNGRPTAYSLQLLAFLCVLFSSFVFTQAVAQGSRGVSRIDFGDKLGTEGLNRIVPLKVGDVVPDELWDYKMPLYSQGEIVDSLSLADFARNKEVLIIDFWPYWCAPCIKSLLHLDSIVGVKKYEHIQFLSINVIDTEQRLLSFMEKTDFKVPTLYDFSFLVNRLLTRYVGYYGILMIKDRRILGAPEVETLTVQNLDYIEQRKWDEQTIVYWPERETFEFARDLGKGGRI